MNAQVLVITGAGGIGQAIARRQGPGKHVLLADISEQNLPAGTRVLVGDAEIEVSAKPHTGCAKFSSRFGKEALHLVSTPTGRALRLRGMNARVTKSGTVRVGDRVEVGVPS